MKRARAWRRFQAEEREKKYIRLEAKVQELWKKYREEKNTLIPLEHPLRVGWYRTLTWKNPITVTYRRDYLLLKEVLENFAIVQWSMSKQFSYLGRSKPSRRYSRRKSAEPVPLPGFQTLTACQYGKQRPEIQRFFEKKKKLNRWTMTTYFEYHLVYFPMYLLKIKRYPRYLYSYVEKNWQTEKDIGELQGHIEKNHLWPRIGNALDWRQNGRDDWYVEGKLRRYREDLLFMKKEMNDCLAETPLLTIHENKVSNKNSNKSTLDTEEGEERKKSKSMDTDICNACGVRGCSFLHLTCGGAIDQE